MKNLIAILFLLFSLNSSAQGISAYNKNTKFRYSSDSPYGNWIIYNTKEIGKMEMILFSQTPVGYKNAVEEINNILYYYKIKGTDTVYDKSLLPSNSEGLYDFENMSRHLLEEKAYVEIRWESQTHYIILICNKDTNGVVIRDKKQI